MRSYLKNLRNKIGLTQREISKKLDISESYYSLIESGARQSKMTIEMAQGLANIFDVSIEVILKYENKTTQMQERRGEI